MSNTEVVTKRQPISDDTVLTIEQALADTAPPPFSSRSSSELMPDDVQLSEKEDKQPVKFDDALLKQVGGSRQWACISGDCGSCCQWGMAA